MRDRHAAHGCQHADVVFAVGLLMDAEVAVLRLRSGWLAGVERQITQRESEFFRGFLQGLRDAPVIDEILETRLLTVRAVAVFDEHADERGGDGDGFGGSEQHSAVRGELLVAGDAAELHAEIDAGLDAFVVRSDFHGVETDVVGVRADGNAAAGIVGNVELARQAVEIAVFQDVMVHRPGVGHDVDEFRGIESRRRRRGDVADVVRAGTLGGEADVAKFHQDLRAVFRHDLADLEVGAGR